MSCQCSSIQFGTVAEVLDRDLLQVIDPIDDCQDVEEAPEEGVLTEKRSVKVSALKDRKKPIDAAEVLFEAVYENNPQNLKKPEGLEEVEADATEVQAEFEEVLDLKTAASCHELQNGSSIRKINESVGVTAEKVLTEGDMKEPSNYFEECPVKVSNLKDLKEPIDVVTYSPILLDNKFSLLEDLKEVGF